MIASFRQYSFVIVLVISGIIIITTSAYSMKVAHEVADIHAPLVDAAMEIKLELTLSHLHFEEHISGDKTITMDKISDHLNQAVWYARAMLSGGKNSEGVFIALDDKILRNRIVTAIDRIAQLHEIMLKRLLDIEGAQPGSDIDQHFDQLFEGVLQDADSVEDALLHTLEEERALQRVINYGGLILSIILFIVIIYYFVLHRRNELQLMMKLNKMATLDELTGIHNRRSFNSTLSSEWNHALRAQSSLSIVLCDIDCFKRYNDTLGHQAGDECLRNVAVVMQAVLQRHVDSVSRYGGEEFAYILPFTDTEGAVNLMKELHDKLAMQKISHPDSEVSDYITLSAGVASIVPSNTSSIEALLLAADQALYRAKEEGRNRTCENILS